MITQEKEVLVQNLIDQLDLECMDSCEETIQAMMYFITRVILKRDFDIELSTKELDLAKGISMDLIKEKVEVEIEKYLQNTLSKNNYNESVLKTVNNKTFIGRAS